MATINSTLISGAGAFTALVPLLAGKQRILLITDANVGKLDAAQQIRAILEGEGRQVQVIDADQTALRFAASLLAGAGRAAGR